MGFSRSMRQDGQPDLRVSNEELARLVAHLGIKVQKLTERVAHLESAEARTVARQKRRIAMLEESARAVAVTAQAARAGGKLSATRIASGQMDRRASIAEIVGAVSAEYHIGIGEILGRSNVAEIVLARHEVYFRARKAGHTFSKIGQAMGRDHSSILHGVNAAELRRSGAVADA